LFTKSHEISYHTRVYTSACAQVLLALRQYLGVRELSIFNNYVI
jgi:hypothetical protein